MICWYTETDSEQYTTNLYFNIKMKKQMHKAEWYNREWMESIQDRYTRQVNEMIAERVDEQTRAYQWKIKEYEESIKERQSTVKFLIKDWAKRYWLTRIFWTLLVICIIIIFWILVSAEYK